MKFLRKVATPAAMLAVAMASGSASGIIVASSLSKVSQEAATADPVPAPPAAPPAKPEPAAGDDLDPALRAQIDALRAELMTGYDSGVHLVVDVPERAYPLLLPKLMMSVDMLGGGPLLVTLGDMTTLMRIGSRRDLEIDGQRCFLVLVESVRGRANFLFGCERDPDPLTAGAARRGQLAPEATIVVPRPAPDARQAAFSPS